MITSITRSKGGTAERKVSVCDLIIHDVRSYPLGLPDERWIVAVFRYYDDLSAFLRAVKLGDTPPAELFVPDLWHTAMKLSGDEKEQLLDVWHLGHDLGHSLGYHQDSTHVEDEVGGSLFTKQ